jgi:hypothetical protein
VKTETPAVSSATQLSIAQVTVNAIHMMRLANATLAILESSAIKAVSLIVICLEQPAACSRNQALMLTAFVRLIGTEARAHYRVHAMLLAHLTVTMEIRETGLAYARMASRAQIVVSVLQACIQQVSVIFTATT